MSVAYAASAFSEVCRANGNSNVSDCLTCKNLAWAAGAHFWKACGKRPAHAGPSATSGDPGNLRGWSDNTHLSSSFAFLAQCHWGNGHQSPPVDVVVMHKVHCRSIDTNARVISLHRYKWRVAERISAKPAAMAVIVSSTTRHQVFYHAETVQSSDGPFASYVPGWTKMQLFLALAQWITHQHGNEQYSCKHLAGFCSIAP